MQILEEKEVFKYLEKHLFLLSAYKKAKKHLMQDDFLSVQLKKRKSKSSGIYQFRITKKYRAFGYFRDDFFIVTCMVTNISDHQ